MVEVVHSVEGHIVRLQRCDGEFPKYHAEARNHLLGTYSSVFANEATDCLSKLSHKAGIDRSKLLVVFGYEP